jgi:hypothetical protein
LALEKSMNSRIYEENNQNVAFTNYRTFLKVSTYCLEIDTTHLNEHIHNDLINKRTTIILQHLKSPPHNILEINPTTDKTTNALNSIGYNVSSMNLDRGSDPGIMRKNSNYKREISNTNHNIDYFNYCLLQDMPPDMDYLDLFNIAWKCMADKGTLIVMHEFTLNQTENDSLLKTPVKNHFLRQANDCGFSLVVEKDYSEFALNSLEHLKHSLDKNKAYILDNPDISNDEFNLTLDIIAYKVREYRNNNLTYVLFNLSKSNHPRWTIHLACESDTSILQDLFCQAFDNRISTKLWEWKYAHNRGMGVLAKHQGSAIAHYGGILRKLCYFSRTVTGVQISDVMVSPRERGLLTKKGAFFKVAAAFPEYFVGYGSKALIGYGFPNMRHMRLAELMGLYKKVGQIYELSWNTQRMKRAVTVNSRLIEPETDKEIINHLWKTMCTDLHDVIIGFRDWNYINHRYFQHPEIEYRVHLVYRRFINKPLGIAVLHQVSSSECRLIDLITPIENITTIITHVLNLVKTWGCETLKAWGSDIAKKNLNRINPEVTETDICIPTSIWTNGPQPDTIDGKWWLMYGDTDFN